MSNVKKCLIINKCKNQNRDNIYKKSSAFLLLEFVATLGLFVISMAIIGKLLHSVAQIQQATLSRAQLISDAEWFALNQEPRANRVIHHHQAQLVFDRAAHAAWRKRWKGKLLLPEQPLQLAVHEIEFVGGEIPISVQCTRRVM